MHVRTHYVPVALCNAASRIKLRAVIHFPPFLCQVQTVCSTHGKSWSCQHATPSCQTGLWGGGAQCLPLAFAHGGTPRPRPIPARLYQRESQQNGGTDTSHVTSLCFRAQLQVKEMDTTRLTNKKSNQCELVITPAVERGRNIEYSPRSVVCTKGQIWRPFCISLRRQHSGAPRCENTAKVIHHQSASNKKNIPIPPLFPSQLASAALPG